MEIPYLVPSKEKDFFKNLKIDDIFEYSMNHYTYRDIETLAAENGVIAEYCKPGTEAYNKYGIFVCQVVESVDGGKDSEKPKVLPKFNPDDLML